jgi:hypothetical protein
LGGQIVAGAGIDWAFHKWVHLWGNADFRKQFVSSGKGHFDVGFSAGLSVLLGVPWLTLGAGGGYLFELNPGEKSSPFFAANFNAKWEF